MATLAEQKTALDEYSGKVQSAKSTYELAETQNRFAKLTLYLIILKRYRIMVIKYQRNLKDAQKVEEGKVQRIKKSLASLK
ncbi:MAG: hypothetical protein AAB438_01380 [Patescibacteria group bacterium]